MAVTNDLQHIRPAKPDAQLRVIYQGGSIAALASASLLASAGHQVIIFEKDSDALELQSVTSNERDRVPGRNADGTVRRAGVPQFRQLHTMLRRGLADFERIMPGFKEALLAAGAVNINFLMDTCGHNFNGYYPDCWRPGIECANGISATRELYETVVRNMVLRKDPKNITMLIGHAVEDFAWNETGAAITGVVVQGQTYEADLIVDATGQRSQTLQRLRMHGRTLSKSHAKIPPLINLAYATRLYKVLKQPETNGTVHKLVVTVSTPPLSRNGYIQPVENGYIQLNLSGYNQMFVPKSDDDITSYAKSLPTDDVWNVLQHAVPVGRVEPFQRSRNIRIAYDKMCLPDGIYIIGDAACAFNPVYGQGMTVAAQGAFALYELLHERLSPQADLRSKRQALAGLNKAFQDRLSSLLNAPWVLSTGEDERRSSGGAQLTFFQHLLSAYSYHLQKIAQVNPDVHLKLFRVIHLIDPLSAMFSPYLVARALLYWAAGVFPTLSIRRSKA